MKKYLGDWVSEKKVTVTALMVENALTRPVSQKKTSNSNDSRGKIATTSEEVEKVPQKLILMHNTIFL